MLIVQGQEGRGGVLGTGHSLGSGCALEAEEVHTDESRIGLHVVKRGAADSAAGEVGV